ncbi:hypothetical protein FB45DRAFT_1017775 [Roridomyces roridus]|uniref:HNH nuclease domain-containing protein n=1 Tax=Roridomyces roridus TaxID=1738132 RepID=A0AAD7G157_9AGAR|nr:hypothetical protein FB45DRAFT_1017775 [Roridomyces roridus]
MATFSVRPLPTLEEVDFEQEGTAVYQLVLEAEEVARQNTTGAKYNDLIAARVLGFLLCDLWTHRKGSLGRTPYEELLKQLEQCLDGSEEDKARHEKIYATGWLYRDQLLRVYISRCKKKALVRDGYKCMLTGSYDTTCIASPELTRKRRAEEAGLKPAECAHIFSESAQDGNANKVEYAATAITFLELFRATDKVKNLYGGNLHQMYNVLTLCDFLHTEFDLMRFWFEEVKDVENTYTIHASYDDFFTANQPPLQPGQPIPALPSRQLLAIRAACSRVVHMSGAAEQYD